MKSGLIHGVEHATQSESDLRGLAAQLASELRPRDRVLLEGPMGAGKSTFARFLLEGLQMGESAEGSPTFALAHEYRNSNHEVVHLDLYRLRSESEIEDAGISAYFWERDAIVLAEWTSLFPAFTLSLERDAHERRIWDVRLDFVENGDSTLRKIQIGLRTSMDD